MQLIDTHTHIYLSEYDTDRDEVIRRAKAAGVCKMILPDINCTENLQLKKLVATDNIFYAMSGVHPCDVKKDYKTELYRVEAELSTNKDIVGIGEIGMDLYWDKTFYKEQKIAFRTQLDFAEKYGLPVSIHQRSAIKEVLDILEEYKGKINGVLHCFSGNTEEALRGINLGFMLGVGGSVTFKNSNLNEVIKNVDLSNLLIETDAPFLTPVPFRGKRNEPAYTTFICKHIARIIENDENDVAFQTYKNAMKTFPKLK